MSFFVLLTHLLACLSTNIYSTANFDEHDEADEETQEHLSKEIDDAEKNEEHPEGRPGTLLNRMISHGNKKTEEQIAADARAAAAQNQPQQQQTQ